MHNLPAAVFDGASPSDGELIEGFGRAIDARDWQAAKSLLNPLLTDPPFEPEVVECMGLLVQKIIDIESARGAIARAERSALDPKAQPLQDLLDHMIYRMAGFTDADVAGLEERLERML